MIVIAVIAVVLFPALVVALSLMGDFDEPINAGSTHDPNAPVVYATKIPDPTCPDSPAKPAE